ncbi:MAG: hypothetical protein IH623_20870 [Verrucomicrobia bacterium]|nr:hypothetical protein [Verrucomicrobiota bacterium]
MKRNILLSALTLLTGTAIVVGQNAKDQVGNAAKQLGEKASYSWKTTVAVPDGSRGRTGPTEGKIEKGGYTHLKMTFGENTTQAVLKGDKAAVSSPEGGWRSTSELENSEGPGRFMAGMFRNYQSPAVQAAQIAADTKELKKDGDAYSSELTEAGAKKLLSWRGRGGGDGPEISDAKGSVKFWVKDNVLTKYEYKVTGKMTFNNNEREVDRTTTVEIKDVGTTKVDVPEEAKKKLT